VRKEKERRRGKKWKRGREIFWSATWLLVFLAFTFLFFPFALTLAKPRGACFGGKIRNEAEEAQEGGRGEKATSR